MSVRDASWINNPSDKAGSIIGQNLETLSQCVAGGHWTHHFRSETVHPTLPPTMRCSFSRVLTDSQEIFSVLWNCWSQSFFLFALFLKQRAKIKSCYSPLCGWRLLIRTAVMDCCRNTLPPVVTDSGRKLQRNYFLMICLSRAQRAQKHSQCRM